MSSFCCHVSFIIILIIIFFLEHSTYPPGSWLTWCIAYLFPYTHKYVSGTSPWSPTCIRYTKIEVLIEEQENKQNPDPYAPRTTTGTHVL